jgi:hypothetical protein
MCHSLGSFVLKWQSVAGLRGSGTQLQQTQAVAKSLTLNARIKTGKTSRTTSDTDPRHLTRNASLCPLRSKQVVHDRQ